MTVIEATANTLQMKPEVLIRESLGYYIEQKISSIEADIFLIARKYGEKDVFEMDKKIEEGLIREEDGYNDYFHLDHLEAELQKLKKVAASL